MKFMAISFFLIVILPLASSLEFSFSSPSSAKINENISISISHESSEQLSGTYDVKIFAQNQEGKVISEIYNEGWKSAFYYIKESYPSISKYTIRIRLEGGWQLCVRLRKTGKTTFFEKCSSISISPQSKSNLQEDEDNEYQNESDSDDYQENEDNEYQNESDSEDKAQENSIISSNTDDNQPKTNKISENYQNLSSASDFTALSGSTISANNNEKIILSTKKASNNINTSNIFISKEEKIRMYLLYAFSFLSLLIIIFLTLKNSTDKQL